MEFTYCLCLPLRLHTITGILHVSGMGSKLPFGMEDHTITPNMLTHVLLNMYRPINHTEDNDSSS